MVDNGIWIYDYPITWPSVRVSIQSLIGVGLSILVGDWFVLGSIRVSPDHITIHPLGTVPWSSYQGWFQFRWSKVQDSGPKEREDYLVDMGANPALIKIFEEMKTYLQSTDMWWNAITKRQKNWDNGMG